MSTPSATARRLFIALMPPPAVRDAIADAARQWRWAPAARPTARERLHLTLHFLGDVDDTRQAALCDALAAVAMRSFTLRLARTELWANGVAAFRPLPLPALQALHQAVADALCAAGHPVEDRPWRPHVTLARHARGSLAPAAPSSVDWPADGFALVWSRPLPTPGYEPLRHWPLR